MTDETKLFAPASREDVDVEKLDCFHLFYRKKNCAYTRALVIGVFLRLADNPSWSLPANAIIGTAAYLCV